MTIVVLIVLLTNVILLPSYYDIMLMAKYKILEFKP